MLSACVTEQNDLKLYPNPANNEVNLEFTLAGDYGSGFVRFVDPLGRIVLEQEVSLIKGLTRIKIPLQLSTGAYSMILVSENLTLPPQKLIVH